jgi:hypothetical protein
MSKLLLVLVRILDYLWRGWFSTVFLPKDPSKPEEKKVPTAVDKE